MPTNHPPLPTTPNFSGLEQAAPILSGFRRGRRMQTIGLVRHVGPRHFEERRVDVANSILALRVLCLTKGATDEA